MYFLFKDDPWGNKVPYMAVSHEHVATQLMENAKGAVTKVVRVPGSVRSIIMM